jgi:dynein heavy chain 1
VESSTALDALQLYTRYCFVQAVQTTAEDDTQEQSKRLLEGLQDKIRQLDVALGQYRRSAFSQIPSITLQVHPLLEEVSKKGTTDLDALGLADKLEDDDFLNEVQSGVTQWIVQIRKVTTLSSTTPFPSLESSQAPDTEEVSFWTQLEAALQHVQQELKKPGVELTLNLLKAAKRFLATIALDNNSGLEGSLAHTLDVCHFLRNYPSLESAGDFDKLCTGMNGIFDHSIFKIL